MNIPTHRKIIGFILLLAAVFTMVPAVLRFIETNSITESATQAGWAVHYDFTYVQRELRIAVALLFGMMALWSREGAKNLLIVLAILFSMFMFIRWFIASPYYPNSPQPEFHILVGIAIISAAVLWYRRMHNIIVGAVGLIYILMEFLIWWHYTQRLKEATGVDRLQPPTLINNVFHNAQWWDIGLLLTSSLLLIWQAFIFLLEKKNTRSTLDGV